MYAPNISRKLQKIVLIVAFAATHALFYNLDTENVSAHKTLTDSRRAELNGAPCAHRSRVRLLHASPHSIVAL